MKAKEVIENWRVSRYKALNKLKELVVVLDKHHKNASVAKLTGTSLGIVGGTIAVAGLLAAPATFGVSLGLTIGGTVAGVAGAATNVGSGITEDVIAKNLCKEASAIIKEELTNINSLKKIFSETELTNALINSGGKFAGNSLQKTANLASIMIRAAAAEQAGEIANAGRLFLAGSPVLRIVSAGASFIFIAIDIIDLIKTSKDLKNDVKSKYSAKLRDVIKELEKNTIEMEKEMEKFEVKIIIADDSSDDDNEDNENEQTDEDLKEIPTQWYC